MAAVPEHSFIDEADLPRVRLYSLLARMLAGPPDAALLDILAGQTGDGTPLGQALAALGEAAAMMSPHQAEREFNALFIGVTRGEIVPYASYYLTGFLSDRPLARLRLDMRALGIERRPGIAEPEDHLGTLCDIMTGLIGGAFGRPAALQAQQRFFDRHLRPWASRCFGDLERAGSAVLYRPVGTVGRLFLDIEAAAFAMEQEQETMGGDQE